MKKIRKILSQLPVLLLWAFTAIFLWTWIFTFLTDTDAEHKLTLYADVPDIRETGLSLRLEEEAFPGIRMVKVREFSDVLFDGNPLRKADLFILSGKRAETYADWFAPLPEEFAGFRDLWETGGIAFGLPLYLPAGGNAAAAEWIDYVPENSPPEAFYLFFGNQSVHLAGNAGASDNLCADAAGVILQLK